MSWTTYDNPPEVVPNDDLRPHELGEGCWCQPEDWGGVLVHQAMDLREQYEEGARKPS